MTTKGLLLEQFNAAYDENGWFVALKNTLENLSAKDAVWKVADGKDNSIWEILSHLNYYNFAYLERFKGVDYVYPAADNDATFAASSDATDEDWRAEIAKFDSIMSEWREQLKAADDAKFDKAVSAKNQSSWATLLSHINLHNAHHGGQIVILRKLQGSWDKTKGVS